MSKKINEYITYGEYTSLGEAMVVKEEIEKALPKALVKIKQMRKPVGDGIYGTYEEQITYAVKICTNCDLSTFMVRKEISSAIDKTRQAIEEAIANIPQRELWRIVAEHSTTVKELYDELNELEKDE